MKSITSKSAKLITSGYLLSVLTIGAYAGGPDFGLSDVKGAGFSALSDAPFFDLQENNSNEKYTFQIVAKDMFIYEDGVFSDILMGFHNDTGYLSFGDGQANPRAPFHFRPTHNGVQARILVDNSSEISAVPRNMFHLANNGAARFVLEDTSIPGVNSYTFATNPSGNFTFSRVGVAGAEIVVKRSGNIEMGPGTTTTMRVTNSAVEALSFTTLSDEASKTDIKKIESEDILDKLSALPVSTWRFKGDKETERHIGPMAQDFHKVFGEGDKEATTINLSDMAGVALAGVKGLNEKLAAKDAEIHQLREALQTERERLDRIEEMLMEKK